MLHIVGLVLKFIGVLLLIILGIVLVLLCTVLFVPIRYNVKADYPDDLEKLDVRATITWILHLLRVDVKYVEKKLDWHVRVAWFHLGSDVEEKTKKEKTSANVPKEKQVSETRKEEPEKKTTPKPAEEQPKIQEKPTEDKKIEQKSKPPIQEVKVEKKKEKIGFIKRIREKIRTIYEQIKCTFQKICDKIKAGLDIKNKIMEFFQDKVHIAAFMRLKKEVIWIKRLIRIKDGNIDLRFGFEDPSLTGKILAGLSVLYPFLGDNMNIKPEFETVCLEGKIYLKGHIRLIHIVMMAIKMVLDKNVRKTFKDIMILKDELI